MHTKGFNVAVCCVVVIALSACTVNPQKRLERVAKDWSMTIRASQVMPIYPLEENLRPGDIYLSTRSMESDIASWNERGFLPLVNRYARIELTKSDFNPQFQNAAGTTSPPSFTRLPKAAFPSYTFEVDRRGSLGLAIPLSSVPVALAIAGAQSATGSVVLKKATTLGLPDMVMNEHIHSWAKTERKKLALEAKKAKAAGKPLVLRVITRVFSIEGANVSLTFAKATSFGADVGAAPTPPELLSASEKDFTKRLEELKTRIATLQTLEGEGASPEIPEPAGEPSTDPEIAALQEELKSVELLRARAEVEAARRRVERGSMADQFGGFLLPGGAARIASRSAHGVSLVEDFEKPLVVGYWALEYLVLRNGSVVSVGNLQELVDDPALYQRQVELAEKFEETPIQEGEVYSPGGIDLPDRSGR